MRKHRISRPICLLASCVLAAGCMIGCDQKTPQLEDEKILNFTAPAKDEEIVVLTIKDYGEVKIKLFPEECEKGVENFKKLVEKGFYDELIFHRVVNDFVIQGGDPKGNGTGGEDAWGGNGFAQTISPNLQHYTGAVAYAIGPDKLNKSQFYIVTGEAISDDYFKQMSATYGKTFSEQVQKMYKLMGGQPFLDNGYEVFGQVFDGLEHCLAIQEVEVNSNDKPKSPVVIEKAEIVKYDGAAVEWMDLNGNVVDPNASK